MDGIAKKPMNWTPKVRPTTKEISTSQRSPLGSSRLSVHLSPSQSKRAMIKLADAYTSVSTALNQKLSEKVKAKDPIRPLPNMAIALLFVMGSLPSNNFCAILVMVQNMNRIVKALETPETKLTIMATWLGSMAIMEKKAPIICNNGAPGGCPTCNLADVAMYSPASQKLLVGSTVMK